jgi:hypothetical protein
MKYKKEELVQMVIKMRLEHMAATKTCLDFLMNTLGYGQTYSYEVLRDARLQIKEYYKDMNQSSLEEALGQLEELAEDAKKKKDYKLAFEVRKDISKLQGLYIDKVDLTSNGKDITEIKLIHITNGSTGSQND